MKENYTNEEQVKDKEKLLLHITKYASIFSFVFFLACIFLLNIRNVIPYIFLGYSLTNFLNNYLYTRHKSLISTYSIALILGIAGSLSITFLSGGINSPFIFTLGLLLFTGYMVTTKYRTAYVVITFLLIVAIYAVSYLGIFEAPNLVPDASRELFALSSILFTVLLVGGTIIKGLVSTKDDLYASKHKVEVRNLEKDTFLKEVHHRVKNNLQTVSSLLSLQSRSTDDERTKSILKSSQNRVISMAMVHEMLYMREDLSKIPYRSYVQELSEYLIKSLKGADNKVTLNIDIADIELGIDTAIPLGLLINEAITNSLKYGIKDDLEGEIDISLKKEDESNYVLNIGDNGEGYTEATALKKSHSLGLKLIHNLARQLKGTITRDASKKGTNYIVTFREIEHQSFPSIA
jgi:two-component sensor histidine kinase